MGGCQAGDGVERNVAAAVGELDPVGTRFRRGRAPGDQLPLLQVVTAWSIASETVVADRQ